MILIIAAVGFALLMVFFMSKRTKNDEDDDPVWLTTCEVDRLADTVSCFPKRLWALWAATLVEAVMFRLDESERMLYLYKFEDWIIDLQRELHKSGSMSKKDPCYPYFDEEPTDLQTS